MHILRQENWLFLCKRSLLQEDILTTKKKRMSLLGKKRVISPTLFNGRLASIKAVFKAAHENASTLHAEMEENVKSKSAQIESLQHDIETINACKEENEKFMENISKLI